MANSLNTDLDGRTVVLLATHLRPEFRDLRNRLFNVSGGFGASPAARGTGLFGTFLADGAPGRMDGYDVDRIATEDDLCALLPAPEAEGVTPEGGQS